MSSEPSTSVSTPAKDNLSSPTISLVCQSTTIKSSDEAVFEKSAKIKEWVKQRLADLEEQNQKLREQNRRCTDQLKALTSCAERNKQSRQSLLFSQSVTGALPVFHEMVENRTSDDSGLTSDETSGEHRVPPTFLNLLKKSDNSGNQNLIPVVDLMTQSTSALLKRSPRQQRRINGFPKTNGNLILKNNSNLKPEIQRIDNERENQSPITTDSSPEEKSAKIPIPAPRKKLNTIEASPINLRREMPERDSLNSYNGEDDYGEYEEDDDEMFEEVDSPIQRLHSTTDYVNFTAFCNVKEPSGSNLHVYSDIIRIAPELPRHQPLLQFEQRLFRTAEKCLSIVGENGPSSSGEQNGNFLSTPKRNIRTSDESNHRHPSSAGSLPSRESQPDSGFGRSSTEQQQNHVSSANQLERPPEGMVLAHPPVSSPIPRLSSTASDYAIPPDANRTMRTQTLRRENHPECAPTIRTSIIPSSDQEMCGYLTAMSENRLRSLKRRYVILKNTQLKFYRTQKHFARDEQPTMTVNLRDVKAVSKANTKSGGHGFEIVLENESLRYQAESEKITEEWFTVLNQILKNLTIADLAQRSKPIDADLAGWVTKVKHGHQKRYYAQLTGEKLLFFKKPDDKIPHSHQNLRGARITEKAKSSSDEYSASSGDEQNEIGAIRASGNGSSSASAIYNNCNDSDYSICIEAVDSDPQYLILRSSEDKDKWLYYLRLAARNAALCGTLFEIFVERLMAESDSLNSELWNDVLLKSIEEQPTETLTTIEDPELKKKALELDLAAFLFTSVQMRPIAIQYHVDLSQNLLSSALEHPSLQNELYAQLIRLTSGSMEFGYQAWKLLSMVIPLYLPKQYSLLWLLKQHVERIRRKIDGKAEHKIAEYCHQALNRRQKVGDRREGPSKLEALSILTRDPTNTILPYSIAVKLPTGDHHVIEFDGSTEIGQCLSSLCLKLNLRPALLSGYSLYANDPTGGADDLVLLKGKQKLCDCLSLWERQMKDSKSGRITTDACSIKLQLRLKNYWISLSDEETPNEKLFLCHRLAEEVVAGHLPLSNDLADELCALYAQMCYGDPQVQPDDRLLDEILSKFYPKKLLEVVNLRSLKQSVISQWMNQLKGVSMAECVRLILIVLRKWKFFGAYIKEARMKINDRKIFIALNESGIYLLTDQLEVSRSFQFHKLINFGEYNGDFMLTVSRILPPNAHPEETPRERITFAMPRKSIEQLTTHLAEYIRCQKLLWKISRK